MVMGFVLWALTNCLLEKKGGEKDISEVFECLFP